ncbi:MAG: DNA polymerase III subunit delta' [Proteobacteria bacterium]|nr:DNA polymerase III subunit delta' [Pseudomonadota bacterium]
MSTLTFSQIVGQQRPIEALRRALAADRLPHALLFSGPRGVGKATTAKALALRLNCEAPRELEACGGCAACSKIAGGHHPDVVTLSPDGAFIKVDQVRQLQEQLPYAPHEGRWRVIVVDGADALHGSAANALLKSVEEPRPRNVFVLVTAAAHRVTPTLVSRSQRLRFTPLAAAALVAAVRASERGAPHDHEALQRVARLAEGSVGHALELLDSAALTQAQEVADSLLRVAETEGMLAVFQTVAEFSGERAVLPQALELLALRLRDLLLLATGISGSRLLAGNLEATLAERAKALGCRTLLHQLRAVHQAQAALAGNANAALTLEALVVALRSRKAEPLR